MKKFIFIMGAAILALCMTACKTQHKTSNSNTAENTSVSTVDVLTGKSWNLIELLGNPVSINEHNVAHLIFTAEDSLFSGSTGCNRISGTYQITAPGRITFSQAVSTRMMCIDMDTENKFLDAINTTDSYLVRNDTLTLSRARMVPLARFVAVQ